MKALRINLSLHGVQLQRVGNDCDGWWGPDWQRPEMGLIYQVLEMVTGTIPSLSELASVSLSIKGESLGYIHNFLCAGFDFAPS